MEDEPLFPSGPWTGFYNYTGPEDRHRMDLHLTFARGGVAGEGNDNIGPFLIRGRYDASTRECHWTKTYIGAHDVSYRGYRDTHGIWGTWEIGTWNKGGFHIWPRAQGEGNTSAKKAEADPPVEAIGTEEIEADRPAVPRAIDGPRARRSNQYSVFSIQ
jgi:hypothetical protein